MPFSAVAFDIAVLPVLVSRTVIPIALGTDTFIQGLIPAPTFNNTLIIKAGTSAGTGASKLTGITLTGLNGAGGASTGVPAFTNRVLSTTFRSAEIWDSINIPNDCGTTIRANLTAAPGGTANSIIVEEWSGIWAVGAVTGANKNSVTGGAFLDSPAMTPLVSRGAVIQTFWRLGGAYSAGPTNGWSGGTLSDVRSLDAYLIIKPTDGVSSYNTRATTTGAVNTECVSAIYYGYIPCRMIVPAIHNGTTPLPLKTYWTGFQGAGANPGDNTLAAFMLEPFQQYMETGALTNCYALAVQTPPGGSTISDAIMNQWFIDVINYLDSHGYPINHSAIHLMGYSAGGSNSFKHLLRQISDGSYKLSTLVLFDGQINANNTVSTGEVTNPPYTPDAAGNTLLRAEVARRLMLTKTNVLCIEGNATPGGTQVEVFDALDALGGASLRAGAVDPMIFNVNNRFVLVTPLPYDHSNMIVATTANGSHPANVAKIIAWQDAHLITSQAFGSGRSNRRRRRA